MRRCTRCGELLPETTEFFAVRRDNGRMRGTCRNCTRRRVGAVTNNTRTAGSTMTFTADSNNSMPRRTRVAAAPAPNGRSDGRIFGVEMEITAPGARRIITALVGAGIRMEPRNISTNREIGYGATNTEADVWTLKHDGSVNGSGLELVSPKLSGESGFTQLETVCAALKDIGASVDMSTGLHVHHDMRGLAVEAIIRQCLAFVERQHIIADLVAPSRRSHHYCPQWQSRQIEELRTCTRLQSVGNIGPRGFLNMWSYGQHGSVEIRAHAGTTNFKKIAAWVRFGQALFAAGEAEANISTTDAEQMLVDLVPFGLSATDAAWLLRFKRAGDRRSDVQRMVEAMRADLESAESVLEEV